MLFIVVLEFIISILSGSAIEVTVKGVVAFLLGLIALTLVGRRHIPTAVKDPIIAAETRSQLERLEKNRRALNRVSRLVIGSVVTGCVVAVFIAVLLSTAANQLLNRLG